MKNYKLKIKNYGLFLTFIFHFSFFIFNCLYSAEIDTVVFEPRTDSNVITIRPEDQGTLSITVVYRTWYSSGTLYSSNPWMALSDTTQTTVRHYIGDRLGDFRYSVQHSLDGGVTWIPDFSADTNLSSDWILQTAPSPGTANTNALPISNGSLLINEAAPQGTASFGNNDWIEIYVRVGGDYTGYTIYEGNTLISSFSTVGFSPVAGDYIVIHEQAGVSESDATGKALNGGTSYWDIWGMGDLTATDGIISVRDPSGAIWIDAVGYSNKDGNIAAGFASSYDAFKSSGMWVEGPATFVDGTNDGTVQAALVTVPSSGFSIGRNNRWTGLTNPPPAGVYLSPYIHDFKRGSYFTGTESEEQQLGMGPGWFFEYQLFDDSYVTLKIYPSSSVPTGYTDFGYPSGITNNPIRTIIHKTPRSEQMLDSSWWNRDEWDCRTDSGTIVDNGVYIGVIDAYDKHWVIFDPSDTNPPVATTGDTMPKTGRRGTLWFSIPVDILRLMKLYSNTITDYVNEAKAFTYRLTGAANVTIKVYQGGATFTGIDTNSASATYGEAIPSAGYTPLKTVKFYRAAGNFEEGWNGYNDTGVPLANGIYTYSISAVNDYKRIATNELGNDHPIWGNITIMRTLKITEYEANQIADYIGGKTFSYSITGAAKVTINVYQNGVTFTGVDTSSTSATYGQPIPADGYTSLKTLDFYRAAGTWNEAWDGYTDDGELLPDGLYKYTISAVSDYGGIATDAYGNNQPMWGNVTITRTEPPSDDDTGGGTGNIVVGTYSPPKNRNISAGVSSVIVSVVDSDVVLDTSKSSIALTDPLGKQIKNTPSVGGKYLRMNVPPLTVTGDYKVNLKLVAKNGKHWNESYKFTVEKNPDLKKTVYAYPNPAKSNSVKIAFPPPANIKIFNLAGDLIKDVDVSESEYIWILSDVGNGLYFYKVKSGGESVVKIIMVAR
ncbi:MAG: T9SS type A sorting domain-containing protein [Elusimicrobiota bacterium]|nr:T9SS type A sorting domain-containing protein [Elusimicrobiota bacterium]